MSTIYQCLRISCKNLYSWNTRSWWTIDIISPNRLSLDWRECLWFHFSCWKNDLHLLLLEALGNVPCPAEDHWFWTRSCTALQPHNVQNQNHNPCNAFFEDQLIFFVLCQFGWSSLKVLYPILNFQSENLRLHVYFPSDFLQVILFFFTRNRLKGT